MSISKESKIIDFLTECSTSTEKKYKFSSEHLNHIKVATSLELSHSYMHTPSTEKFLANTKKEIDIVSTNDYKFSNEFPFGFSDYFASNFSSPKKVKEYFKTLKLKPVPKKDLHKYCEFAKEVIEEQALLLIAFVEKEIGLIQQLEEKHQNLKHPKKQKVIDANVKWYLGYTAPIELVSNKSIEPAFDEEKKEEDPEKKTVKNVRFS